MLKCVTINRESIKLFGLIIADKIEVDPKLGPQIIKIASLKVFLKNAKRKFLGRYIENFWKFPSSSIHEIFLIPKLLQI